MDNSVIEYEITIKRVLQKNITQVQGNSTFVFIFKISVSEQRLENYESIFLIVFTCLQRIDAFELWCWRRPLRILWTEGRPNQSILLLLLLLNHFSRVRLCATPYTAAHQAPPSLGFSRQEHSSGLPFPSPTCESEK